MAFALINSAASQPSVGGPATPAGFDSTGADLLVASVRMDVRFGETMNLADSYGNTWTTLTQWFNGNLRFAIWWCSPPGAKTGTGHTFTETGNYVGVSVSAWSGSAASPFDQEGGFNNANPGALGSASNSALTASQDGSLYIASYGQGPGGSGFLNTINAGFTIDQNLNTAAGGGDTQSIGSAYLVQTTAASITATWSTVLGAAPTCGGIACFKPAGATLLSPVYVVYPDAVRRVRGHVPSGMTPPNKVS